MSKDDSNKLVLDACCGPRMFWFDKENPNTLFCDIRKEKREVDVGTPGTRGRKPKIVKPDLICDFRKMPFADNSFHHVVFDPPHVYRRKGRGKIGTVLFSYGILGESWEADLALGFSECFRVLKVNGTLIFKWHEAEISITKVLSLTPQKPLYGHKSGKKAQTHWVAFLKEERGYE